MEQPHNHIRIFILGEKSILDIDIISYLKLKQFKINKKAHDHPSKWSAGQLFGKIGCKDTA